MNKRMQSFLRGTGRVFDLGGVLNRSLYDRYKGEPRQVDFYNFCKDWEAVGQDMLIAAERVRRHGQQ